MDLKEIERLYELRRRKEPLEEYDEPIRVQAHIVNLLFDLIPANRVAILLERPDSGWPPEPPERWKSALYAKRTGNVRRFQVSAEALKFVYTFGEPYMSNDERPARMCAPLVPAAWTLTGVIYLDTRESGGFEIEHLDVLQTICKFAAKLIHRALKYQADQEEAEDYQELLELDEFEGQ